MTYLYVVKFPVLYYVWDCNTLYCLYIQRKSRVDPSVTLMLWVKYLRENLKTIESQQQKHVHDAFERKKTLTPNDI